MMPAENSATDTTKDSELFLLNMKEIVPFNSNTGEKSDILTFLGPLSSPTESNEGLNLKSSDRNLDQFDKLSDCDLQVESDINVELEKSISSNKLHQLSSAQYVCPKKSLSDLQSCSLKELELLLEEMSQVIKKVSSELVQLLLENDALQQESDARNVAIEQLLKMTVKNTECELRPIQMSVVLPDDEDSDDS